ncbi:MAG: hypothetical protein IPF79_14035 [Ignavibacteria bacterium]|nr:hypothetical protein [Ignavibacteria bacterium]
MTCWNKISAQDQKDYLLNYFGHGSDTADWIFVSIEEAGSSCSVFERVQYWLKEGKPQLVDAPAKQHYLITSKAIDAKDDFYGWHNNVPKYQPFLEGLERIVALKEGGVQRASKAHLKHLTNDYRLRRTGAKFSCAVSAPNTKRLIGGTSLTMLELFPLPAENTAIESFKHEQMSIDGVVIEDKAAYKKWCLTYRYPRILDYLRNRLDSKTPPRVIILGLDKQLMSLFGDLTRTYGMIVSSIPCSKSVKPSIGNGINSHSASLHVAQWIHPSGKNGPSGLDYENLAMALV